MLHQQFWLPADDDTSLFVRHWSTGQTPRAVLMIAHGMCEHSGRYGRFAEALNGAGFDVFAHDQRGHGRTAEHGQLGHFDDAGGWQKVLRDLSTVNHWIRQQHPATPILLLGHSMGSFLTLAYLMQHSSSVQGAILSGSDRQAPTLYRCGALAARFERWRQGAHGRSALLQKLSFGSYNRRFRPARTEFDWLSSDPAEVDRYIADPLCGFRCSNQFWLDLLRGLATISAPKALAQIADHLPLLVIGGADDPVSQGTRLNHLAHELREAGARMELKIYPDARHELLNERNRDEVTHDLIDWLNRTLSASTAGPATPEEPE
jgi:alpha-beta hydrolase superfamily lysophospholipase